MEFIGDEKRIQALFSEMRFQDVQIAPPFSELLNRDTTHPSRFNLALAFSVAVLLGVIGTAGWWEVRRFHKTTSPVVSTEIASTSSALEKSAVPAAQTPIKRKSVAANRPERLRRRLVARESALELATNRALVNEATAISSWTSPTDALLSSSTAEVLKTLPQLNENANQLKSFLNSSNEEER